MCLVTVGFNSRKEVIMLPSRALSRCLITALLPSFLSFIKRKRGFGGSKKLWRNFWNVKSAG